MSAERIDAGHPSGAVGEEALTRPLAQAVVAARPLEAPGVLAATQAGLLDWISAALAGRHDSGVASLRAVTTEFATGGVTVVAGGRASAGDAALINGYMGHALDYDDVHVSSRGHPSAVVLPALLALAEERRVSGARFLAAYAVGVEVMCRLGMSLGAGHYERGWHSTATLGAPAAAAACAYLMAFDQRTVEQALGIAATQAAGLRVHFGTQVKALHAGLAARAGLNAVQIAGAGLLGSPTALDGASGFTAVYGDETAEPSRLLNGWGEPWQIADPGLWFKLYPCCSAAYHAAEAAMFLQSQRAFSPREITRVTVTFPPRGDTALSVLQPKDRVEGRFSVEYVVAAVLLGYPLSLETFGEGAIDPAVHALMQRVERRYDDRIQAGPSASPPGRFSVVTVETSSGTQFTQRVERPRGAPGSLLTPHEQLAKFQDATAGMDERVEEIPALVAVVERLSDLRRLTTLLQVS